MANLTSTFTVSIASGQSLSAAIDTEDRVLAAINLPAAWSAADLSFDVSADGNVWVPLRNSAGEVTLSAALIAGWLGGRMRIDPLDFWTARFVRLRSGVFGAAVTQGATRTFSVMTAGF